MDLGGLENLGKIAGIAGIAIGALVLIFRSLIHKNFMSQMTVQHSYSIIKSIVTVSGIVAIMGILTYAYLKKNNTDDFNKIIVKGQAVDAEGNGIKSLEVSIHVGEIDKIRNTDSEGIFMFEIDGKNEKLASLSLQGFGYKNVSKNMRINFNVSETDFGKIVVLKNISEVEKPSSNKLAEIENADNSNPNVQEVDNSGSNENFITISSSDYSSMLSQFGSTALVQLTVDGISYTLTGQDLRIPFQESKKVNYSISGSTKSVLGVTSCSNQTNGKLIFQNGITFYFFEDLNRETGNSCNWYLFSEQQYAQQKNKLMELLQNSFN